MSRNTQRGIVLQSGKVRRGRKLALRGRVGQSAPCPRGPPPPADPRILRSGEEFAQAWDEAPAPRPGEPAPEAAPPDEGEAYGRSLAAGRAGADGWQGDPAVEEVPAEESVLTDAILGLDEEEEPFDEQTGTDTPEIVQVRRLCRSVSKAVKAVRLYPLENPMCRRFADDLHGRLVETFQLVDAVRLSVGKTKFFFLGEPVLDQGARDDSVPARLFWDGIREITFHMGLGRQEILDFLALFRKSAMQTVEGEDDLVTLLWEGRFEHITYIAIDDILDLDNADDPIPEEFGKEFMNYVDLEMHDLDDDEEIDRLANEIAEEVRARINSEDDPELFGISREEREALRGEVDEGDSPRMLSDIVEVIGETLYLEKDETHFVSLVQVLSGAMLGLIGEGRVREAGRIVGMLRGLLQGREDHTPAMRTVIEAALRAAWDDTRCEAISRHLEAGRPATLAALDEFVAVLPAEAVRPFCEILGRMESPRARRHLIDSLIAKADGSVVHFLPFLKDPRWFLVRNVALILGSMKTEAAVGPLKELLRHPDFRVRREALAALSQVGRGRAVDVLVEALYDPDQRIRVGAARNLALVGRKALPALLTVTEEKDFDERDLTEKRAFYEALGFAGGREVLPLMHEALNRRALLFKRTQVDEIRACACEALGWIGGSEAQQLLNEYLQDRSVIVRTAAQSGLRRIANGRDGESIVKEAA